MAFFGAAALFFARAGIKFAISRKYKWARRGFRAVAIYKGGRAANKYRKRGFKQRQYPHLRRKRR